MTQSERRPRVTGQVIQAEQVFAGKAATAGTIDTLADIDAERALISAVLQEPDNYAYVADMVEAGDMFLLANGYLWYAFERLFERDEPMDIMSVVTTLEGVKGCPLRGDAAIDMLSGLYGAAPNAANVEYYARRVRDAALRLRLVKAADDMKATAFNKQIDTDTVTEQANELLFKATDQRAASGQTTAAALVDAYHTALIAQMQDNKRIGVATGWSKWDNPLYATGGLYPGTVTVVGGMSGFGKTTWLLSLLRNICKAGKRAVLFTLEMRSIEEIMQILVAMESGVSKHTLRDANLSAAHLDAIAKAVKEIATWKLDVIDDFRGADTPLTPLALRRRLRVLTRREPIDVLGIDGLWLMEDDDPKLRGAKDRPRAVSRITDALANYSKGGPWPAMPIVITHQYNREINTKQIKKPAMHHFAESAGVERNANVIVALWRQSGSDYMEAHVIKDRLNGNNNYTGTFQYLRDYSRYEEA